MCRCSALSYFDRCAPLHPYQVEAVARVLKNALRSKLREAQKLEDVQDSPSTLLQVAASFLNTVFGHCPSTSKWMERNPFVVDLLRENFNFEEKDAQRCAMTVCTGSHVMQYGVSQVLWWCVGAQPPCQCSSVFCFSLSCLVFSFLCLFLSFLVLSCIVLSCLVLSCLVLSCLVLSCLVLSCLVLSCPCPCLVFVLSCLVLSCLVLPCTTGGTTQREVRTTESPQSEPRCRFRSELRLVSGSQVGVGQRQGPILQGEPKTNVPLRQLRVFWCFFFFL
jgi:hypothetical protein